MLQIQNYKKSFGENEILKGINLSLDVGKTMVLLGKSGSGKSTLLKCLNLLDTPSIGKLIIENQVFSFNENEKIKQKRLMLLRRKIGMVFQHFNLWPHLCVLDNLTLAPLTISKHERALIIHKARDLLERLGLTAKVNCYPGTLSGGEKQRVAIARTLMMDPKIILFDEPTSSLDPEMVYQVLQMIADLKQNQMTMIIATHEINFAKKVADYIVFLDQGEIHECGSSEIIDKPNTEKFKQFLRVMQH